MGGLLPGTLLSGAILHSPSPELRGTTNGVIINGANTGTLLGPPALGTMVALFGGWHASGIAIAIGGTIVLLLSLLMAVVEKNMNSSA
jgi:predicted MFS family arabinose efflux permease